MSTKIQIIKRLEMVKNAIELEEEDLVHLQIEKLKQENNNELNEIIKILENDDYSKINKAIDNYVYGYKNAELTPHQKEVFDKIATDIENVLNNYSESSEKSKYDNFLALSGSAGVGKTFVTAKLVEEFIKKEYKILLTTPTHKSLSVAKYMINSNNIHVNAKTLQSYLDLRLDTDYLRGTKSFKRDKKADMHDYERNLDILIVDESSMVSNELLKFIEENLDQNKLKAVLFIGDEYQLPPIDEAQNGVVLLSKQYKLSEIVRQAKDSYVKMIANDLKECIKNKKYTQLTEVFNQSKYPQLTILHDYNDYITDFTKNPKWYEKNNKALSYSNGNVDEVNYTLRYKYWLDRGITPTGAIMVGEILIFNENYKGHFQNSEIVTVTKCEKLMDIYLKIEYWNCTDTLGRSFLVVDPDFTIKYNEEIKKLGEKAASIDKYKDPEGRKKAWRNYFITKEKYADLKYIFASTIHKSQGSTYDISYINVASMASMINRNDQDMAYRLLYVAVTRASKDIKILL